MQHKLQQTLVRRLVYSEQHRSVEVNILLSCLTNGIQDKYT
jgi:hypothetical protein